ncbi:MAG: heparinase II/III family protein [Spirochaetes bacterium]|nr:heparinase II/III family protein [Spirochaetota bacterium]
MKQSALLRTLRWFSAACLLASLPVFALEKALVNPGFLDKMKPGVPDDWQLLPAPDGQTTRLTVEQIDGKPAIHLVDQNAKAGVGLAQNLVVEGGKTYRAAIAVRQGEVKLYLNFLDGDGKLLKPEHSIGAAGGKRGFETTELIERAPDGAKSVRFWLYSPSTLQTECFLREPAFGPAPDKVEKGLTIPVPTRAILEKKLLPTHPRLYLTKAELERIRRDVKGNASAARSYALMMAKAESMLKQDPSKYEIPDGLRLLTTSRRVLDRALVLGLAFRLTGEAKYKARLWGELEAAAAFPDWNPKHFLDTAELMHAFALGYDWLWNEWTPEERKILEEAVAAKGLKPTFEAYRGRGPSTWWVDGNNNWNFVCNGGASVAALGFWDSNPDLCADVFTNAFRSFQHVMEEFEPDGAWYEGPGYWHYSLKYLSPYFRTMETALGTNFGVFEAFPGFRKTADFPVLLTGPSGLSFNFADAGSGKTGSMGELFYLARQMQNPVWHAFEKARLSGSPEELLYFDAALDALPLAGVGLDRHFRKVEVAQLRSDWGSNALFLGIKAGANGTPHFHYDLGSFVLDAHGTRFIDDLGMEPQTYVLYKYPGVKHEDFYRIRPEGHNTLVINPGKEAGQGHHSETRIENFRSAPDGASAVVDLTPAYKNEAKKAVRTFSLVDGRKSAELTDEVQTFEPATLWWFAHIRAEIAIAPGGKSALLTRPEGDLKVNLVEPKSGTLLSMPAAPLPSSPNPDMQNKNAGVRKLALVASNVTAVKWVVRFTPAPPRARLLVSSSLGAGFKPDLSRAVMVEAEAFFGEEGGRVEVVKKIGNSVSSFKGWDAPGHQLSWKFTVPATGDYGLMIRYCTADELAERRVLVDGKPAGEGAYRFPGTGGYSSSADDWKDAFVAGTKAGLRLALGAGEHTITLVNVMNPMNLDWLKLVPLAK